MNLFIQVETGQPINHPAFEDNLIQAFGRVPENWEAFVRVEHPTPAVYEVLESDQPTYQKVDGVWTDVWSLRPMTQAEKDAKQQAVIAAFNAREQAENWSAWALDEATCTMQPPIPRPEPVEGVIVFWSGAEGDWKVAPFRPQDGKPYKFDFLVWAWVEVAQ